VLFNRKSLARKINFVKEPLADIIKGRNSATYMQYTSYRERLKVKDKTIFYESRDGKSLTDSPFAIFSYLLNNPDFKDYQHIWSVQDMDSLKEVLEEYKKYPNVIFVKRNSKDYLKKLATSQYLINNSTFQPYFCPKKEQVYINTWHGTPLKTMGYDIPGNPSHSQNVVRNFLSASYLLSPNEHTTDMFLKSYKLDGLYAGTVIEDGYPRIDLTLNSDRSLFLGKLQGMKLSVDSGKKTILYAPTWKGEGYEIRNDMEQIISDLRRMEERLSHEYNVLVKVHPFLYKEAVTYSEIKKQLVPDFIDTNQLLGSVDVLVTDYSSIFFDYLVTDKPILFYMWDEEDYSATRNTSLRNDELPGPILKTIEELIVSIENIQQTESDYILVRNLCKERFCKYDDGHVTKRLIDYLFHGKGEMKVFKNLDKKKEKMVIYPGGMRNNGITSSMINLSQNIDYEKYDVTCFITPNNSEEALNNLAKMNKNIRLLFKVGHSSYTLGDTYRDKLIQRRGIFGDLEKKIYPEKAYKIENERLFGLSKFDYAIDFSGYSYYWSKYLVNLDVKKKICYMHNDLLSDSERTINGKKPHRQNLRGLFSIYHKFDKLVSVSKSTMELNRKNLSVYADYDKFDYVMNSIVPDAIKEKSGMDIETIESVPRPTKEYLNFVNMGRLSPEKAQGNLIEAFARFHEQNKMSRLYILGEGPLRGELEQAIERFSLKDSVFLVGQLDNPFSFLKLCDCFVLSSHYEGQPMVLLESLTLGMNIIATEIVANRFVLEDGKFGILVEDSVEGLMEGLNRFASNGNKSHEAIFDAKTYNKKAMETFYKALNS